MENKLFNLENLNKILIENGVNKKDLLTIEIKHVVNFKIQEMERLVECLNEIDESKLNSTIVEILKSINAINSNLSFITKELNDLEKQEENK